MENTKVLQKIYPAWMQQMMLSLAKGASVQEDLNEQLDHFFRILVDVSATGDRKLFDPLLSSWASSLTVTELESGQSGILPFIREIMVQTIEVCKQQLDLQQAFSLVTDLIPAFMYALEQTAFFESHERVAYVSKQLKQAQETLERLDKSKSDFIAVAAHELRTPLTLVEGYSAMLRELREPSMPGKYEIDLMDGINNGTRRLKTIIDDMIDVSLIDNNLMQLNFQPVWINRLLDILKAEMEEITSERAQTLTIQAFPGSAEMTYADPERLMQVFRNVLSNAIKYTPDEGTITISGRKLPGFIEVIVRDSGIGINPEDQNIIFEKFTRLGNISLHSSGKTKFKGGGPGLGLHIAKGIIEAHGGAIWVESPGYDEEKNPGSTFHILLPLISSPPESRLEQLLPNLTDRNSEGIS